MLEWSPLTKLSELDDLVAASYHQPQLIYKHSTRCGVSSIVKNRLQEYWDAEQLPSHIYLLDLIRHREVSNFIAEQFSVRHESPQVLLIHQGICHYHASHFDISAGAIKESLCQTQT